MTTPNSECQLQQSEASRRKIILSFWTVVILSLPVWWQTTKVERKSLPENELNHWISKDPCPIRFPVHIKSNSPYITRGLLQDEVNKPSGHPFDIKTARCFDFHVEANPNNSNHILVNSIPIASSSCDKPNQLLKHIAPLSRSSVVQAKDSKIVKHSSHFKLVFSLMNEDITQPPYIADWEIREAIRLHLAPTLQDLAPLHNFTFETQISYYSPLTSKPIEMHAIDAKSEDQKLFIVEEDDLKAFINEADWSLASTVSMEPVLHFVLYVPAANHRPFKIRKTDGTIDNEGSFIRPQWGSVQIYNPPTTSPILTQTDLSTSFSIFTSHLLSLLGILGTDHLSLSATLRQRILEVTHKALNELDVIVKLSKKQTNMRISGVVQRQIRGALQSLKYAQEEIHNTGEGGTSSLPIAISHVNQASKLSSKAVFNPTMLSLLYFPDEHKYAVYTPLFGPVFASLFISLFKEAKRLIKSSKEKEKEKTE